MFSTMGVVEFKEVLTRKPLDPTSVQGKPASKAIMEAVKCCVCLKDSAGPAVPSRFCQDAYHPICRSCFSAYRKLMKQPEPLKCPSFNGDGQICGSPIIKEDRDLLGVQFHSDYLEKERGVVPCVAAALFGCKFVGSYQEMVEHVKSDCYFIHLLVCKYVVKVDDDDGATCDKMFEAPKMLYKHQKEEHGLEFSYTSELSVKLGFDVPKTDRRVLNKWMMLRRVPIDFDGKHFSMLIVDENKTHVRMWLCEIGPMIIKGPAVEYCITVPFGAEQKWNPFVSYKFRNQIYPYGTGDRCGYLEVSKDFLKSVGEVMKDGRVEFRIFIQFKTYNNSST